MTWKVTNGEKTRLKRQVESCFIKTYVCVNLGVKYPTISLCKDVQSSSGRSQNHYCLPDAVCVNIKEVLSSGARKRAIKSVLCGITADHII